MTIQGLETIFNQDSKALYLALADHIAQAIVNHEIKPGEKLPTQRAFAKEVGVTTGTVTRAFQELERRGLISGEVGRGTFVRATGASGERHDFGKAPGRNLIDMAYNLPPPISGEMETEAFRTGLRALADSDTLLRTFHYHFPQTDAHSRDLAQAWLKRCGVLAPLEECIVAAGGQNALFVSLLTLCRPGDEILCEALTYPGFRSAAEALQLRVTGIPIDDEGLLPAAFEEACLRGPKLLYLIPTLQNPTTITLSSERRREIVAIARRHKVALIEDDIHALLSPQIMPPLSSLYPEGAWYLGNTDKLLAPALRICFMRVPSGQMKALERMLMNSQWMVSPLGLWLAGKWIEDGTVDRLISARRQEAAVRLALAKKILVHPGVRIPEGGYFVWLPLPAPWRSDEFQLRAMQEGVALNSAEAFAPGPGLPQALRICLGGSRDQAELSRGLEIIQAILEQGPADRRPVF